MAEVVAHATATLHELYLLLIDTDDAAVAVGLTVESDHKAIRQRAHLEVVANTGHRAALGHRIAEIAQKFVDVVFRHSGRVLGLDSGEFAGDATMHVVGALFVDVAVGVFKGVFIHPHLRGKFIAVEVFERGFVGLVVAVCFSV